MPTKGKTRITIYIDDRVLEEFRARAEKAGGGYQTMINDALKAHLADGDERPLTASVLRQVIREELPQQLADSVRRIVAFIAEPPGIRRRAGNDDQVRASRSASTWVITTAPRPRVRQ